LVIINNTIFLYRFSNIKKIMIENKVLSKDNEDHDTDNDIHSHNHNNGSDNDSVYFYDWN